ncbi:hypothetical protein NBRC116583_32280 [Arenicella sp. 4NH20-0111]|uniref:chloride channel protein n=1 Tax=Arenicella sp. 4NH20-0111 TaxID=3127648 RepID=UPI0031025DA6
MKFNEFSQRLTEFVRGTYHRFIEAQQVRLASDIEGLPLLALLGLVCGVFSGGIIILFRLVIESNLTGLLPDGNPEGFESLSGHARFLLCAAGGIVVGFLLHVLKSKSRNVGIVHVIERLDYHQGHLPFRNAVVQFFVASISLISGQSVGKEGPSVHLGAAGGSSLGRLLSIPNNGVRILVGSGVAAAISAAFDTPLAGVIFAMEVVIMEYTVVGFTPVILAAVSAASLTRLTFGDASGLFVPEFTIQSVADLPVVALMGAFIGFIAAAFIQTTMFTSSAFNRYNIWLRTTIAGVFTGLVAFQLPEVMGTGYDTVDQLLTLSPEVGLGLTFVILLLVAKTVTTAAAIGLGVPAGLIGPTLFIGAAAGAASGLVAESVLPDSSHVGLFAVLGMAAMMAATLQAPLAALIYLLELTTNHAIILPGMTAVITASLVTRVVFGKSSIYRHLMLAKGLDYRNSPLAKALRRVGVASVMDRKILQQSRHVLESDAFALLKQEPRWVLIVDKDDDRKTSLLPATDLARYLNEQQENRITAKSTGEEITLDLLKIPAKRLDTTSITIIATLQEAHEKMNSEQCEVLYINGAHGDSKKRIYGVVTREHIESSYRV